MKTALLAALIFFVLLTPDTQAQQLPLQPSVPIEETQLQIFQKGSTQTEPLSNFRLVLKYNASAPAKLVFSRGPHTLTLPAGEQQSLDLSYEHIAGAPARILFKRSGDLEPNRQDIEGSMVSIGHFQSNPQQAKEDFPLNKDFTVMVEFQTQGNGTLFAKAPSSGKWQPHGKTLFIRGGRLVYDIGWVGALVGKRKVNDGKPHTAVLRVLGKKASLFLDGAAEATKQNFSSRDDSSHVIKIGSTATNFGGDWEDGTIHRVQYWKRALNDDEVTLLAKAREEVNTPDFHWTPPASVSESFEEAKYGAVAGYTTTVQVEGKIDITEAWVQPLEKSSHRELVAQWDDESFHRGQKIYQQLCVTCHGTPEKEGSIPLALKFHEGEFKNGHDPYRMFQTLENGYGLMVPQPQYSTRQKYDVIHYIRESFLKSSNSTYYFNTTEDYLASLPAGMSLVEETEAEQRPPQYKLMDFGNVLFGTYQIEPRPDDEMTVNIAQKGIAIRLDPGPGGVSHGKAWAIYDHDTMRLAAYYTGDQFVDWRGIDFDGSHGTHTSIVGERIITTPDQPGWAHPETGKWEAERVLGKDGRKYGPVAKEWMQYKGIHLTPEGPVIEYTIGDTPIFESLLFDPKEELHRVIRVGKGNAALRFRAGEKVIKVEKAPTEFVTTLDGQHVIEVEVDSAPISYRNTPPLAIKTQIQKGEESGAFATDILTVPDADLNPHQSWMRLSGVDFFPDGKRAALCTWMGDVWIVEGIDQLEGELTWKRICSGLFQPLGIRIVDGAIFVSCRDQIAKLHDKNGDETIDFIECFNNDHQVTEHFHEFAMGLQTDAEGNFYYAKSARHAKTALVPHHGTLLKVSKDGSNTKILASGFRAANGVCLNPDGSFIVTDQEGHWNPKNRINWVNGNGPEEFFGNIYGYTPVTDESDAAMTPPLCWITNAFDRSPSELLWVPENAAWGSLNGTLLNLSYGYGKVYVVPHEEIDGQKQGGMCELPIEPFPTGVMRGRFHPTDGQLYACGMFAWGGNQKQAGGFYRVRRSDKPAYLPVRLQAKKNTFIIELSDSVDSVKADDFVVRAWDLKRSKNYGSKHLNEREWEVTAASLSEDGSRVELKIPQLQPTWGMSVEMKLRGADGVKVRRLVHNSIHSLGN